MWSFGKITLAAVWRLGVERAAVSERGHQLGMPRGGPGGRRGQCRVELSQWSQK